MKSEEEIRDKISGDVGNSLGEAESSAMKCYSSGWRAALKWVLEEGSE